MKNLNPIQEIAGDTDIYLLDQIMKGRYDTTDKILDAGCGAGRNMHWFLKSNINIYGIDTNIAAINNLKLRFSKLPDEKLQSAAIENTPFANNYFDHIISSAVLHFAKNTGHFYAMFAEMVRVLKPGGTLFIRMTSDICIEEKVQLINDGVYKIPDGSIRFLLTKSNLKNLLHNYPVLLAEPLKTVNVDDIRCMSTLVLQKE